MGMADLLPTAHCILTARRAVEYTASGARAICPYTHMPRRRSSVAEQRFRKPQAVGSSPTAGSIESPDLKRP